MDDPADPSSDKAPEEALTRANREIERLRSALEESDRKLSAQRLEAQHRVRNLLSVMRVVSGRSLELSSSLEELAMHQSGRIAALSRAEAAMGGMAGGGADLEQLLFEEWLAVVGVDGEDRTTAEGPPVTLTVRAAERVGLAFHELTTNALKFGAISRSEGSIVVRWELDQGSLRLSWLEQGVALMDTAPQRMGFGRDYLERALAYDLAGRTTLLFSPGGVRFTLAVPLRDNVTSPPAS